MKTIRLLGYYGTESQSCSAANRHNSSKQRKNDPEGDTEIRAASSVRKTRTITSLLTGLMTSAQSHEDRA